MTAAGEALLSDGAPSSDDHQGSLFEPSAVVAVRLVEPAPKRARTLRLPVLQDVYDWGGRTDGMACRLSAWEALADAARPRTMADCVGSTEPCIYVGCRHHMWSDDMVAGASGPRIPRRIAEFEHLVDHVDPEDWGETCSLRVAARVVLRPSETGKWIGASADGEAIARPGPSLVTDGCCRRWEPVASEISRPDRVDAAVLGRFLGGLSREQIRKNLNAAAAKVRADPEMRQWAVDNDIDPDRVFDVDDD